jgi:5'-nucleotidase
MDIFLTNDDGIDSAGILLLAASLRKAGHKVMVLAPDGNRSGFSHSISFFSGPIPLRRKEEDVWTCPGSPVDCVILALLGGIQNYTKKPDLVLSGINAGANIGTDILYSGTAAAARQGSLFEIPSVALSLVECKEKTWNWDMAAAFSVENLDIFKNHWKKGTFVNVNIPNGPAAPAGITRAFPAVRVYNDGIRPYEGPDGGWYCSIMPGAVKTKPEAGSDWDAVSQNRASLSSIYSYPVAAEDVNINGRT